MHRRHYQFSAVDWRLNFLSGLTAVLPHERLTVLTTMWPHIIVTCPCSPRTLCHVKVDSLSSSSSSYVWRIHLSGCGLALSKEQHFELLWNHSIPPCSATLHERQIKQLPRRLTWRIYCMAKFAPYVFNNNNNNNNNYNNNNNNNNNNILTAAPWSNFYLTPPGRPRTMWIKIEDYPAGPQMQQPLPEWSNWRGSESSTSGDWCLRLALRNP